MTTSSWRRSAALLLGSALLAAPALVGAPAAQGAVSAPALQDGTWWFDALKIGAAQEQSTGEGVTIGLVDTMIDPTVPDLAGADVVPVARESRARASAARVPRAHDPAASSAAQ